MRLIESDDCIAGGHSLGPYASLSANGRWAVGRHRERWVGRWDCEQCTGDLVEGDWDAASAALALSSSGQRLAVLTDAGTLSIRNTHNLNLVREVTLFGALGSRDEVQLSFGAAEDLVCAMLRRKGTSELLIRVFDVAARTLVAATAPNPCDAQPRVTGDGLLTILTWDGVFAVDRESKRQALWERGDEPIMLSRLSTTGRLAVGSCRAPNEWAVLDLGTSPPVVNRVPIDSKGFSSVSAIADETQLLLVGGARGALRVTRWSDAADLGIYRADRSRLHAIHVSSDGRTILTAGWESTRLWKVIESP